MYRYIKVGLILIGSLILGYSCCEGDQEFWFPEGAIQYYDTQDTITFYCPETDAYTKYYICSRDTLVNVDHMLGRCDHYRTYHEKFYELSTDSCGNSNFLLVFLDPGNKEDILVKISDPVNKLNTFIANYDNSNKISTDVLGHTYENVIRIPSPDWDPILSILFSYEYGVIQIQYEDRTLSLVNSEI